MADLIDQQLGNYRLIRRLAEGGFAEVYLGKHLHLGTEAAVKVLHARLASPDEATGFKDEARIIAQQQCLFLYTRLEQQARVYCGGSDFPGLTETSH